MTLDDCNIILIVSDTFRKDHLGCYGNSWIHTPNLDKLAQRSIVFENAHAASYPTMPCRADLMTGRPTFTEMGWAPLPREIPTVGGLLQEHANYTTMGIVDTPFYIRNGYGYDRGFADFIYNRGQRFGDERTNVTQAWNFEEDLFAASTFSIAEKWVEKNYRDKFFLLIDTWDPHESWDPPTYYLEKYYQNYDGRPIPYPTYWYWKEAGLSEDDLRLAHAAYCAEITLVDRWAGRFLERLESLDLLNRSVVIFTSDHGFYFGEHGILGKGMQSSEKGGYAVGHAPGEVRKKAKGKMMLMFKSSTGDDIHPGLLQWQRSPLYQEVTRVPLLVSLPGHDAKRIEAMVSLPDLMPTILEFAGVDIPESVRANSLGPLIDGKTDQIHDFLITSWPLYVPGETSRVVDDWERIVKEPLPSTITDGEWSLIFSLSGEPAELYHLTSDPKQENNVIEKNESIARDLHAKFVSFLKKMNTREALLKYRQSFP